MDPPLKPNPQAVLFACGMNSVRSPIAASLLHEMFPHAIYVGSAGVRKGELDPFAIEVMAEIGHDIRKHRPMTFEELEDWEGLNFDLIVTLSPEAHHKALELTRTLRFLCDCAGTDKVVLGSDHPFPIGDDRPVKVVEDTPLTTAERGAILGDTAQALFGIG